MLASFVFTVCMYVAVCNKQFFVFRLNDVNKKKNKEFTQKKNCKHCKSLWSKQFIFARTLLAFGQLLLLKTIWHNNQIVYCVDLYVFI